MVLVDTSVWVDHFRKPSKGLSQLLAETHVGIHPFVVGELACGCMPRRREVLALLHALPEVSVATQSELLHFIEQNSLAGTGIGFVDAHLLASAELMGASLWTIDKILGRVADRLNLVYSG